MLVSDRRLASGEPRRGVRVIQAESVKRDVRAYSKELFRSAEEWAIELEESGMGAWDLWVQRIVIPSHRHSVDRPISPPKFSSTYRKRLHMPLNLPPVSSRAGIQMHTQRRASYGGELDDPAEEGHFRSLTDQRWNAFMEGGFDAFGDGKGSISKKLEFDLTEGAKAVRASLSHTTIPRITILL